jgi:uncharacterized protein YdaU (DUF1376 family)
MAEFPAMPLWTDALIGDTYTLTPAEFGAYMRLLIFAWRTRDCALPSNDAELGRMIGDPKNWHRLRTKVMAFFTLGEDGRYRQYRLLREREYVSRRTAQASAAGRASALKRLNRPATGVPTKKQRTFNEQVNTHTHTHTNESSTGISPVTESENSPSTPTNATSLFGDVALARKRDDFIYPEWWPHEAWIGFVAMRKKIRAPLTPHATKLIVTRLSKLKADGEDPTAVLDQSTRNDWRDVYPVRPDAGNGRSQSPVDLSIVRELMRKDDKP